MRGKTLLQILGFLFLGFYFAVMTSHVSTHVVESWFVAGFVIACISHVPGFMQISPKLSWLRVIGTLLLFVHMALEWYSWGLGHIHTTKFWLGIHIVLDFSFLGIEIYSYLKKRENEDWFVYVFTKVVVFMMIVFYIGKCNKPKIHFASKDQMLAKVWGMQSASSKSAHVNMTSQKHDGGHKDDYHGLNKQLYLFTAGGGLGCVFTHFVFVLFRLLTLVWLWWVQRKKLQLKIKNTV